MKKYSIILSAVFGLFALASCQKVSEIVAPGENDKPASVPFELVANIDEPVATKTTLDVSSWAVDWEDGDIIYAVTTDAEWGVAYKDDNDAETVAEFTYDSTNKKFTTTSTISDGEHTFNFLYSNGTQKSYHRGASTTHSLYTNQTFDASNPTENIKAYDALAAQLTATTPASLAGVSMSHLYTLMKVTLKNKTGNDITATKFEISADSGTYLYGIHTVTFGSTPTTAYSKNGGNMLAVNIANGAIAAGETLDVYFVMAPLSNYSGDITFVVTDSENKTYTKTNAVTSLSLAAGTYNTATYTFKKADEEECVSLNWLYEGGTSSDLEAVSGVKTSGLGTDYAESHAPYRVKFDTSGDYIQVKTDQAIGSVEVGVKLIAGKDTDGEGAIVIYGSADGVTYTQVESLSMAGAQNDILTLKTTATFDESYRYVRLVFTKKVNIGVGPISIYKVSTGEDPTISAEVIDDVAIAGGTFTTTYTLSNWSGGDDVVATCDGTVVTEATASDGTVSYTVAPNYTKSAKTGTITLTSVTNGVTITINVSQLASSGLTVSETTITIPVDATSATFTLTTADYGWDAAVTVADGMNLSVNPSSGDASASAQTVTVSSTTNATTSIQTLGTIVIYRNGNTADTQKKTITVKKAAEVTGGKVTYTVSSTTAVTTSGTAPEGSSATYSQTYSTKCQMTAGNTITLTLSGYAGIKITGAEVSVRSNAKAGAGYLSLVSGSNTIASIGSSSSPIAFNNSSWNGAYSSSYVTKTLTVTETTIEDDATIVLTIGATTNSLYFESLTLYYN